MEWRQEEELRRPGQELNPGCGEQESGPVSHTQAGRPQWPCPSDPDSSHRGTFPALCTLPPPQESLKASVLAELLESKGKRTLVTAKAGELPALEKMYEVSCFTSQHGKKKGGGSGNMDSFLSGYKGIADLCQKAKATFFQHKGYQNPSTESLEKQRPRFVLVCRTPIGAPW